jgi:uncharacterized phage protein gp47/JayE
MSTFVVQNADQLRDTVLDLLRAQYEEFGEYIDTSESSDAYRTAAAQALLLEVVHARLLKSAKKMFPDTAETADLEHHARVFGLSRKPATSARLVVLVGSGASLDATIRLAGETLGWRDGTKYLPINADGTPLATIALVAGSAEIVVEAQTAGVSTNRIPGDELVWSTAPAGLLSSVEILSVDRTAADAENDEDFAGRVLRYMTDRPGGGNCADWSEWCERFPQVHRAFVYPVTKPSALTLNDTPGAVCVVIVGAPPNLILSSSDADHVKAYIEGEETLDGDPREGDPREHQLRFCALDADDITIMAAIPRVVDVSAELEVVREKLPPWRSTFFITAAGCTDTVLQVTVNPAATGVEPNDWIAIQSPLDVGKWVVRRVAARDATSITLATPLADAPIAGREVRAAWSGWESARDAVLDVFAGLGPGDYPGDNTRRPESTRTAPPRLYSSALVAALLGFSTANGKVGGVSNIADVVSLGPSTTQVPAPLELLIPGEIVFLLT